MVQLVSIAEENIGITEGYGGIRMRKYIVSAVLIVFTIAAIGTYYVLASQETLPNYKLTTVQGDASQAENVLINGNYVDKDSVGGIKRAYITIEGTDYPDEKSVIVQSLNSRLISNQKDKWIKEHRQFMRKKTNTAGFFENEEMLAYVNAKVDTTRSKDPSAKGSAKLSVSVLNKQKNNTLEITSDIEVEDDVSDMYVQNVQLVNQELVALVLKNHNSNGYVSEPQIIRVNLTTKKITNEPIALPGVKAAAAEGDNLYVWLVNPNLEQTEQWILRISNGSHRKVFQVDIKTGQITPLEFQGHEMLLNDIMYAYGQNIYFLQRAGSGEKNIGFNIISYDLVSKKYETILKNTNIDLSNNITAAFKQDHLYIMGYKESKGKSLYVFNLKSGKLEYEGTATSTESKNQAEDEANMDLNFIDLGQY